MIAINSIDELKANLKACKEKGLSIGLVPTMGYLHEGHLSLIKKAREDNDIVVVSIFVNPTQFGPKEDFDQYPRDRQKDLEKCEENQCDYVFLPQVNEMYPEGFSTYVEVEKLGQVLCGESRPTHFEGVATILTKLFNITKADRAYFGQKDAQQLIIVQKMVKDLNMDIEIIGCPIVREKDGLALSSRNTYLSEEERKDGLLLYESLVRAKELIDGGERNVSTIKQEMKGIINRGKNSEIDYIEFVNGKTLAPVSEVSGNVLIAIAVQVGNTRLIDNVIIDA
ncbi:pantoate--beta-alanine ligase [Cerasibacillus terrae]|uniref:Pantothenate synthetase n=1 Tax=Cerasibacillus terrae TaxID=2498845 RepID=A0A5C8NS22_9BACI|nr:pantoate--beta-alanine ligase [Cerasibacillus terrae]TXL63691.1 pantoate--beta-alanine ligase [Cerasibacillus terrae]